MADFVYTTVPGKIKLLLQKIREVGVPAKATAQWLKIVGFKSSNDTSLLTVLKFIGFVDSPHTPSPIWTQYRGANSKVVLGDALRKSYADLFAIYADANQRNQSDIAHVFATSSSGGKQVIMKMVSTFNALAEQAEFPRVDEQTGIRTLSKHSHTSAPQTPTESERSTLGPALHIDIQIHISPESSADQIDKIFASMSKYLYGQKNSE